MIIRAGVLFLAKEAGAYMSDYIVEMRHITKRFPGIVANDDVTLQIKKGEIFALLGENGAGKTTIMSMLFGMYEPDEGEIWVRGKKERITSPNYASGLNIGMVHQHFKLVSNYTVTENIILGIEPVKKTWFLPSVDLKGAEKRVAELSRQFGLEVDPKKRIDEINVSMQQRVEILKMLYRDAEILILDEPTAILTPSEIEYLLEIIRGLKEAGKTIILITHKLEEIKKVADRCAILKRGKLVDILDVASTTTREMANKMVGRAVSFEVEKTEKQAGDVVLKVEDLLVRSEDRVDVVKHVDLEVRKGEIVAIAGVSGNGQVELADAIAGLMDAESGRILLNGTDITKMSVRERIECGLAYIPEDRQTYGLVMDFNLDSNLALKNYYKEPLSHKGILNDEEIRRQAGRMIEDYDIRSAGGVDTLTRSMSGGNQQKAIVAREIEQDAQCLIFVQPTRGLDIGAIENIHRQIIAQRDKGKAILLISLELDEVMALADTIAVIYNGEILRTADAKDLSLKEVGQYMMGVTA